MGQDHGVVIAYLLVGKKAGQEGSCGNEQHQEIGKSGDRPDPWDKESPEQKKRAAGKYNHGYKIGGHLRKARQAYPHGEVQENIVPKDKERGQDKGQVKYHGHDHHDRMPAEHCQPEHCKPVRETGSIQKFRISFSLQGGGLSISRMSGSGSAEGVEGDDLVESPCKKTYE